MTETEWWLTESQWRGEFTVTAMTEFLADVGSERKLRLFTHACCQRISHLFTDPRSLIALVALARYVEDECDKVELGLCWAGAQAAQTEIETPLVRDGCLYANSASVAAGAISRASHPDYEPALREPFYRNSTVCIVANSTLGALGCEAYARAENQSDSLTAHRLEAEAQSLLLRDIFGNPFRSVAFDPSWRSEAVTALARGMYESRDFAAMPVLADALDDAGCADADILAHCRGPGPHVRGCWVVDLVLGKS